MSTAVFKVRNESQRFIENFIFELNVYCTIPWQLANFIS